MSVQGRDYEVHGAWIGVYIERFYGAGWYSQREFGLKQAVYAGEVTQ